MFKRFVSSLPSQKESLPAMEPAYLQSEILQAFPPVAPLVETLITSDVSISGKITFSGILRMQGKFEGETLSSGTLIAEPSSIIVANLDLEEAIIAGTVRGNITVQKRLTLLAGAQIEGNIRAPLLHIEEGVILNGKVEVSQAPLSSFQEEEDFYSNDN